MPAFSPRYEIEVSQLPRWPTVSLSRSAADAGDVAASAAAVAAPRNRYRAYVILPPNSSASLCAPPTCSLLLGSAQHGRSADRRIAGLDPHVDHGHLTRFDRRD